MTGLRLKKYGKYVFQKLKIAQNAIEMLINLLTEEKNQ